MCYTLSLLFCDHVCLLKLGVYGIAVQKIKFTKAFLFFTVFVCGATFLIFAFFYVSRMFLFLAARFFCYLHLTFYSMHRNYQVCLYVALLTHLPFVLRF